MNCNPLCGWQRLWPVVLVAILAGCHGKAPPNATVSATSTQASGDSGDAANDPCSLLLPKEAEAVLGAPLAVPPFRSMGGPDGASANGDNCVYETGDFRYLTLAVDFTDGAQSYSMVNFVKGLMNSNPDANTAASIKHAFKLDDGTELSGEWDEATLTPMNCCIFNALRADQMITVDFTATRATIPQAATLIDDAFKRIDKPLQIDGNAGVAAAHAYLAHRIKPVDPCTLLTRAEVEAIIGRLAANPTPSGTDSCTYRVPAPGIPRIYQLNFTWRNGYYQYRSNGHVAAATGGMLADMAGKAMVTTDANGKHAHALTGEQAKAWVSAHAQAGQSSQAAPTDRVVAMAAPSILTETAAPSDAWEQAETQGMSFAAVKKDVMVTVDLRGVDEASARRLVAAAMRKI